MPIVRLCEMSPGDEGDFFALLSDKQESTTRTGKPYWRVTFRDARREVNFPVWENSPWAADCQQKWAVGTFYKVQARLTETSYGPQLEIRKIREAVDADAADGFDPWMCIDQSRYPPKEMLDELMSIVRGEIPAGPLQATVLSLVETHREKLLTHPAAKWHHHAFMAGLLEHTLSVTRTCVYLAGKYAEKYDDMRPPLDRGMVVAGAVLHDIGKLVELEAQPTDTFYTAAGALLGHLLLGRDMVRQAGAAAGLDAESLLRLEHVVIAHQRLPEWGSPKPPMTPEALIIHYADDLDAKFDMMYRALRDDKTPGPLTSDKNLLRHRVFRGDGGDA